MKAAVEIIRKLCILFLITLYFQGTASADGDSVIFTGNTIDIGLRELAKGITAASSKRDLESLAAAVTDRYHKLGYTTTMVEKIHVRKDGIVEIAIRESKIAEITVRGVSDGIAKSICAILRPSEGELYNVHVLRSRSMEVRRRLDISSIKIRVLNRDGSEDVSLVVTARRPLWGTFRGEMLYEPIYGLSPFIEYRQKMAQCSLTLHGNAGVRQSEFRKKEGVLRFSVETFDRCQIFADFGWTGKTDVWESAHTEYHERTHRPSVGMNVQSGGFVFELSFVQSSIHLRDYPSGEDDHSELFVKASAAYRETDILLPGMDGKSFAISASSGKSSLLEGYFMKGEAMGVTSWSPAVWLTFRSKFIGQYVSAHERYYMFYVFDRFLPGFADDFTSTTARLLLGVESEFEVYPDTVYLAPLVNGGRFRSEAGPSWYNAVGSGISISVRIGTFGFQAVYAWDIQGNMKDGSFLMTANGTF